MTDNQIILDNAALANLLDVVGGDEQMLRELIQSFLEDAPRLLDRVEGGLQDGDAAAVHLHAHSLKSNAADFGALELAGLCRQMELIGKSGDLREGPALLVRMQDELQRSAAALRILAESLE